MNYISAPKFQEIHKKIFDMHSVSQEDKEYIMHVIKDILHFDEEQGAYYQIAWKRTKEKIDNNPELRQEYLEKQRIRHKLRRIKKKEEEALKKQQEEELKIQQQELKIQQEQLEKQQEQLRKKHD
jgi:hypothetical protein